ncbi:hypothetical protein Snas_1417 [Stackebrandtia nassauensis DSM 44728]|uniref:Uncharacterized protein n=1 Tax=Stackebrandtia nassauensis (strain DSM 44728 / CIP 108903 / NRRL B-16338 / NBRC 102104 / LLR-40K-21) TaxID=446470 RepID=D3PV71_STANL|nr:hypothetical protein Snas_1417 [Stackebrandtia nassauensis DSM 44728]
MSFSPASVAETAGRRRAAPTGTPRRSVRACHTYAVSVNGSCGYRRREFLLAGLAAVLSTSACTAVSGEPGSLDSGKVLRPVLKTSRELAAAYEAAAKDHPQLGKTLEVLRDNHSEHAKALARILGDEDGEPAEAGDGSLDSLRQAESKASKAAVEACAGAPDEFAVLLGEIAACRATHHDVLKVL